MPWKDWIQEKIDDVFERPSILLYLAVCIYIIVSMFKN